MKKQVKQSKRNKRSKRNTRRTVRKRSRFSKRGGSIATPMIGSLEGEDHKGLEKIVVAGPMGVMSGSTYLQTMENLDQQGSE